jgi:DNA (cytosine-5)-methyltransferase 1
MNVLSLFSGVGGFDLGLENAGMKTIYQCEWDKHATRILERHWPTVPRWGDISTLTAKEILSHGTPPDVVAWGSPCQDLSVAGLRRGLSGERSGLFHEGIRIINELRKETNNEYPRISIWENVAGALSSNRGADFGVIIDEMAKAGAMVIEWGLLDAQHFGIPQRRRRVFCIAIFNSATATNCPNPLLPIGESLRGNPKKGKPKRKGAASETSESLGASGQWAAGTSTDGDILRTSITSKWSKGSAGFSGSEFYNMVVENDASDRQSYAESSFGQFKEGDVAALKASGGVLGGGSETLIAEPYVKSRRAQSVTDDETWVPGQVNPTLNSFDVGDTRATRAIIEPILIDGTRVDDVRVYEPPVQTLGARMGTGGNNVPVIGFSHTQGLSAQPSENAFPTLRTEGNGMAVAIPIDTRNALRDPEKYDAQNRQGLGIGNDGDPMATLTSTHVNAVAYGIQGNVIGRQPENGPVGKGHTEEGDPMFTLTGTDIHAVAYDEYNDSINETHHALRAGTKQSTGVLEPTMAVRRLTPLECERLMGWPDDHTRYKADGTEQADTHRYKQCGNGVASPVAEWIGKQLMKLDEATE